MAELSKSWKGLKSWLAGYISRRMGTPLPTMAMTGCKFSNGEKLPPFPEYNKKLFPFACLVHEPVLLNTYSLYISKNEFKYDVNSGLVEANEGEVYVSSIKLNDGTWGDFKQVNIEPKIQIEPLWASKDIKDTNGEIRIKTYSPILIYGCGGWND